MQRLVQLGSETILVDEVTSLVPVQDLGEPIGYSFDGSRERFHYQRAIGPVTQVYTDHGMTVTNVANGFGQRPPVIPFFLNKAKITPEEVEKNFEILGDPIETYRVLLAEHRKERHSSTNCGICRQWMDKIIELESQKAMADPVMRRSKVPDKPF